jgi:hypothetical protein
MSKSAVIYTPSTIAYVQAHYNVDQTAEQIAVHIGTTAARLRRNVERLRHAGHEFTAKSKPIGFVTTWNGLTYVKGEDGFKLVPRARRYQIGETRQSVRKDGRVEVWLKTADGWEYVRTGRPRGKPAKEKVAVKPLKKSRQGKHTAPTGITQPCHTPRAVQRFESIPKTRTDRNPDKVTVKEQTGGSWVRINEKTIVYRKIA